MKRANLVKFGQIIIEDVDVPSPEPGRVRVAVRVCGICGTDVHAFQGHHPFINAPVVPGHEFSGEIDALGQGVEGLAIGQKVTVEPSLVCGECEACRSGRYNICENLRVLGCQADGAMAEMISVPAEKIVRLPKDMSYEQGALIEPTAVAVHALRRADLSRVERLLVIGSGPMGLQTLQVAHAWGIPIIVATDIVDGKLAKASELGATYAINVSQVTLADFFVEEFGKPNPMDLVMECVGTEAALSQAIESVKEGGQIVIVGVPPTDPKIRLSWVQDRELELLGTLMYTRSGFEEARDLIATGKVQTEPLITARYPLERVGEAMNELLTHPENSVKTLITIQA
ncbi:MAG: alcohol dehydrogenase catalytic domain-containing protein [Anaerolineae bacterium]|nr:alcohol dehydrogenase catalytic domain-containing protein [Anaerolineae bacterium]